MDGPSYWLLRCQDALLVRPGATPEEVFPSGLAADFAHSANALRVGEWQGLPSSEFRRRWDLERELFLADPWNWKGHRGESDADVFARAWPALLEALARARGGTLALASHYNVIRVVVTRAMGWRPHESFAFQNDPAHAALLVDAPGGWQLAGRNLDSAGGT